MMISFDAVIGGKKFVSCDFGAAISPLFKVI